MCPFASPQIWPREGTNLNTSSRKHGGQGSRLPSHQLLPEALELRTGQTFGEDVAKLLLSINRLERHSPLHDFSSLNHTVLVQQYLILGVKWGGILSAKINAPEFSSWTETCIDDMSLVGKPTTEPISSTTMSITGNNSRQQWAREFISGSMVESAISLCNFEIYNTRQSERMIRNPVLLLARAGSVGFS